RILGRRRDERPIPRAGTAGEVHAPPRVVRGLEDRDVRLQRRELRRRALQEQEQVVRLLREGGGVRARPVPDAVLGAGAETRAVAEGRIAKRREQQVVEAGGGARGRL